MSNYRFLVRFRADRVDRININELKSHAAIIAIPMSETTKPAI